MDEIRYIAGSLVGAGVDRASLDDALQENPHFIACDAGSTDPGPFSLGSGEPAQRVVRVSAIIRHTRSKSALQADRVVWFRRPGSDSAAFLHSRRSVSRKPEPGADR